MRQILVLAASAMLIVTGMGSSCPGTSSTANFNNPALLTLITSSQTFRQWTPAMIIDQGALATGPAADSLIYNTNMGGNDNLTPDPRPATVFHDATGSFYALFNSSALAAPANPTNVYQYATQQIDMTSSGWVTSLGSFTQLDPGMSMLSDHSMAAVDKQSNTMAVFIGAGLPSNPHPNQTRPLASLHLAGNGPAWDAPVDISDVKNQGATNAQLSLALNSDPNGNFVAAWVQGNNVFFNEYRPNLGWRFHTGAVVASNDVPFVPVQNAVHVNIFDRGVDVGFDSYGNGYAVFVANLAASPAGIYGARWRSDRPENFPNAAVNAGALSDYQQISVNGDANVYGYPRLWVAPNGAATTFWWQSYAANQAQLWWSHSPPVSTASLGSGGSNQPGPWSVGAASAQRFPIEQAFGTGMVLANPPGGATTTYSPVLAYDGSMGAVGFIKFDGQAYRFYVAKSSDSGATWSALGTADLGGIGHDVKWGHIAVNLNGDVAVVYSAIDPIDFREHIYGNVNSGNVWTGLSRIDTSSSLLAGTPLNSAFPVVSIDEAGNACAVFSIADSPLGLLHVHRRTAAAFYRF